jgi:hypothetical protein
MEPSNNTPRRTMSAKRASMRPLDVRRILADQGASEARPSPTDYVASPPSPSASQHSTGSSGRTSFQSHGRTMSMASVNSSTTMGRQNRFSMQFPIQPTTREQSPHRPTSSLLFLFHSFSSILIFIFCFLFLEINIGIGIKVDDRMQDLDQVQGLRSMIGSKSRSSTRLRARARLRSRRGLRSNMRKETQIAERVRIRKGLE